MPNYTHPNDTPPGSQEPDGWAVNLRFLTAGSDSVQVKGKRPSYHAVIHFVGYAGIARTALGAGTALGTTYATLIYAACILLALITGKLVQRSKSDRFPRICSASLGLAAFTTATLATHLSIHHETTHGAQTALLVIPLSATGFMILINLAGEVLARWCARNRISGPTEADRPTEAATSGLSRSASLSN